MCKDTWLYANTMIQNQAGHQKNQVVWKLQPHPYLRAEHPRLKADPLALDNIWAHSWKCWEDGLAQEARKLVTPHA